MDGRDEVGAEITFVLVPGAGGSAWYWHRVVEELRIRGQDAVAVELPAGDDEAGLQAYADAVVAAGPAGRRVVLVAQSMGAYSAPLACDRLPVELIVLVNPMVPAPGESAGSWWETTAQAEAMAAMATKDGRDPADDPDLLETFFHDVPDDLRAEAITAGGPAQSGTPFDEPWPLERWPDVPTVALVGRDDRFFPAGFQHQLIRDRLGIGAEDLPGGHLVALSQPHLLAERLVELAARVVSIDRSADGFNLERLHHVQLAIPPGGESECRAFWGGLIGMREIDKPTALAARGGCWFAAGGVEIHLGVEDPFRPARKAHPGVLVTGLAALAERLQAAGHEVTWDPDFPGHDRIYTADPFGNRLELLEPHPFAG